MASRFLDAHEKIELVTGRWAYCDLHGAAKAGTSTERLNRIRTETSGEEMKRAVPLLKDSMHVGCYTTASNPAAGHHNLASTGETLTFRQFDHLRGHYLPPESYNALFILAIRFP